MLRRDDLVLCYDQITSAIMCGVYDLVLCYDQITSAIMCGVYDLVLCYDQITSAIMCGVYAYQNKGTKVIPSIKFVILIQNWKN